VISEVTVQNPAYWSDKGLQLAQLLRSARPEQVIGDPTGTPADPDTLLAVAHPEYWSTQPGELEEVLRLAAHKESAPQAGDVAAGGVGAAARGQERLTLTVEEAAAALGISRSFAYEAVYRKEIPHVKIGRRILVPKAALQRMLEDPPTPDDNR